MNVRGHAWTLGPFLRNALFEPRLEAATPFSVHLEDGRSGRVRLTGSLLHTGSSDRLVVLVHGLGGGEGSYYMALAAQAAWRAGVSSLRLNLRGADRSGEDIYHAGLVEDLQATLSSDTVRGFKHVHVVGFSLGGHMLLRYLAVHAGSNDIASAAAICPPVHLASGAQEIDRMRRRPYRRHVLRGLKDIYRQAWNRQQTSGRAKGLSLHADEADRIDTIRGWDEHVVAPRFGFGGADDYWNKMSACHVLADIETPTLLIASKNDPMIPSHTVEPWLSGAPSLTAVVSEAGGHVGFPRNVDFGLGFEGTLYEQTFQWLVACA